MNNPCNECIVRAICQTGCDELTNFIEQEDDVYPKDSFLYVEVARLVRMGILSLEYDQQGNIAWRVSGNE